MLLQTRHQFDEVARPVSTIQLPAQNLLPTIAASARRAGQSEQVSPARNAAGGSALDRRGLDLAIADPAEQLPEARDLLFIDRIESFGRDVATGEAGTPGGDHHVDRGI